MKYKPSFPFYSSLITVDNFVENTNFSILRLEAWYFPSLFPYALIVPPKNRELESKNIQRSLNGRFLAGKPAANPDFFTRSCCLGGPTLAGFPGLASVSSAGWFSPAACKGALRGNHPSLTWSSDFFLPCRSLAVLCPRVAVPQGSACPRSRPSWGAQRWAHCRGGKVGVPIPN